MTSPKKTIPPLNNKTNIHRNMQSRKIFITSSALMTATLYLSFIIGMIPVITEKLELSLFQVSILTSVNFISAHLCQPIFGFLSDKYGIKFFLMLGPLVASIFISLIGVAPSYGLIIAFLFIGNLGIAAAHPPSYAVANYFGGNRKGFANALVSFGATIGFSLGSIFIILIIKKIGLMFTPLATIPGLIITAILIKYAPSITMPKKNIKSHSLIEKLKKIRKLKLVAFLIIVFVAYCRELINLSLFTLMPIYFTESGLGLLNFGNIMLAFIAIGGVGGLIVGYFSDRIEKRHIFIQVLMLLSVPIIYLIFSFSANISILFFILVGLLMIPTIPLTTRMAQDMFPNNINLASSISFGTATGVASLTLLIVGKVADINGIIATIRYLTIFPIIAGLLISFLPLLKRRVDNI